VPDGQTTGCQDHIRYVGAWQRYCVEWRYFTTDGQFVMIKDRHHNRRLNGEQPPGRGWVFISRSALVGNGSDKLLPQLADETREHRTDCADLESH
jgi:hypothetical protein